MVVVWLGNMMLTLASSHRSVAIGGEGEAGLIQAYETRIMTAGYEMRRPGGQYGSAQLSRGGASKQGEAFKSLAIPK